MNLLVRLAVTKPNSCNKNTNSVCNGTNNTQIPHWVLIWLIASGNKQFFYYCIENGWYCNKQYCSKSKQPRWWIKDYACIYMTHRKQYWALRNKGSLEEQEQSGLLKSSSFYLAAALRDLEEQKEQPEHLNNFIMQKFIIIGSTFSQQLSGIKKKSRIAWASR